MIDQAKDVLERLSDDPDVRDLASWREAHLALDRMQRQMEREEAQTEGHAEGHAEGRAEGRAEGLREMLLMLSERAGGGLSDEQRQRVEGCDDLEQLDQWIRKALDGAGPDEIFG